MLSAIKVAHHAELLNSPDPSGLCVKVSKDCESLFFQCAAAWSIRTWVATYMFCMKTFTRVPFPHKQSTRETESNENGKSVELR